ncbi:membrane protein insertase YidC [Metamycoplasma neophronis]|uniref:Membrane protein insertase YidC n=1 Tax=Metamycoplasma neophronis TaxID=872983 RepID=A0ABY2Z4X1_9BACT|nr:membrane protein insertase YidC [Metamycoplasma neophronis]TPR54283.1 membrane protein insertase YidC [Metamycoplasma neophronis]
MANKDGSKHYQEFRVHKPENKAPKNVWKQIWKWLKIVIMVLFITVGLVGCVQSFSVKSSTKVGAGQEVYVNKADISPNVVTMRYDGTKNMFVLPNKYDEKNVVVNTYLGLKSKETVAKLREQDQKTGGDYGIYGGSTFALQLQTPKDGATNYKDENSWNNVVATPEGVSTKEGFVYERNGNYVYMNLGTDKGVGKTLNYQPVSKFTEIYVPVSIIWDQKDEIKDANANVKAKVNDYTSLQSIKLQYVDSTLPGGTSQETVLLRDLLQILMEETLVTWNKSNTLKIKVTENSSNNEFTFNQIIGANPNATGEELIQIWNAYLQKYAEIAKNQTKITEAEGQKFNAVMLWTSEAVKSYLSTLNFRTNGYRPDGKEVLTHSNISAIGNFSLDNWKNNLYNTGALVPQKAVTTYKEYWQQGPFYGMFVQPVNAFMHSIISSLGTTGWSVILALVVTVIIVRLITFIVSFKTLFTQSKMEEFNQKKAKIEAKYSAYKGDKQMQQRKQMEISELYKREKISPFGQIVTMFITLPILIVVFRIISTSPEIKQASWYGIQLSATSINQVFRAKEYIYIPIILVSIAIQALAQYMPKILNWKRKKSLRGDAYQRAAMKKENRKANIISLVFIGIGVLFSAGLQIYWIIGGIWTIFQHIFVFYFQRTKLFKTKVEPRL